MAFPPTDWLDWTTAEYEVGAPATSLSFERWFRNPVAIAQAAPDAPIVVSAWHPYNANSVGDGDGVIYNFATMGAVTSITTPDFVDGWHYRLMAVDLGFDTSVGGVPLGFELQRQDTNAWIGYPPFTPGNVSIHTMHFPRVNGQMKDLNSTRIDFLGNTKIKAARINGTTTRGRLILQRAWAYE